MSIAEVPVEAGDDHQLKQDGYHTGLDEAEEDCPLSVSFSILNPLSRVIESVCSAEHGLSRLAFDSGCGNRSPIDHHEPCTDPF